MSILNIIQKITKSWLKSKQSTSITPNFIEEPLLSIELVPSSCWFSNVRSEVSKKEWDIIRKASYKKAGYRCEICSGSGLNQGFNHPVECHEIWHYDDKKKIQKLEGFISLCPMCHKCKHIGLAMKRGELDVVFPHMMTVNNMTVEEVEDYIDQQFAQWRERSKHQWTLDIDIIQQKK